MNRRTFLAALGAAFTMDPEELLWVPGKKKIVIFPPKPKVLVKVYKIAVGVAPSAGWITAGEAYDMMRRNEGWVTGSTWKESL